MNRRLARMALLPALAATLAGCGVSDRVVGLRDAPVEQVDGAPMSEQTAQVIVTRVLGQADKAFAASDKNTSAREAVLIGPALRLAAVAQKYEVSSDLASLTTPATPQILAISEGREWPRSILATSRAGDVQRLHLLISDAPTAPYKLWVTAPMVPGSKLPALPPLAQGTTFADQGDDDRGLVADPVAVFTAYGRLIDSPRDKKQAAKAAKVVNGNDLYAKAVRASSVAQVEALGSLGTFRRHHGVVTKDIATVRLADGSALAFGQMVRTDRLRPTSKAKQLDLPSDLARLAGERSVTKSLDLDWLLTLVAVIPAKDEAHIVGASEQLREVAADEVKRDAKRTK